MRQTKIFNKENTMDSLCLKKNTLCQPLDRIANNLSDTMSYLSRAELSSLSHKRVAIPGLGGVGGNHLICHIQSGFTKFNLADFDQFEVANTNRQYGAKVRNIKKNKLDAMVEEAFKINQNLDIVSFPNGITENNIDQFLNSVDIIIDSLDAFVIDLRILLYQKAKEKGIPIVAAAPLGFGTSVICFSPNKGLSFEEYYGIHKDLPSKEKFIRFIAGAAPKALHSKYVDFDSIQPHLKKVPSLGAGCITASAVACTLSTKILLNHPGVDYAPAYLAIDPYLQTMKKGRILGGFKNPIHKIKVYFLGKVFDTISLEKELTPTPPEIKWEGENVPYEVIEYIVKAGIQAPSGDNTQPWKFKVDGNLINLQINTEADRSFFNVRQKASILACGAVIENIKIAASVFGLKCDIQLNENIREDSNTVALIRLIKSQINRDALFHSIWERCTNRKQYSKKKIEPFVFEELQKITNEYPGLAIHIIDDRIKLRALKSALVKIGIARQENQLIHEFLFSHIRNSFEEALKVKTGFAINNLEAGNIGNLILRYTKNWKVMNFLNNFGFSKVLSKKIESGIENCGACILITVPDHSNQNFVKGGMALQRIWLKLTEMGVAAQPMTTANFFHLRRNIEGLSSFSLKHQGLINSGLDSFAKLFPNEDMKNRSQIMLMRIGYSKGIKTWTVRHKVNSLLEFTETSTLPNVRKSIYTNNDLNLIANK